VGAGWDEDGVRLERARAIGLFRYRLIREVADPGLGAKARGRLVRGLAEQVHTDPFGRRVRVSRKTLDRWVRAWRAGGFEALVPVPRQSANRTDAETLALAAALKRENPARTAAQVARIMRAQAGWSPSQSTLLRYFHRVGLQLPPGTGSGTETVFGRFEAAAPNQLWTGDALHGKRIAGRKTYLFAFIDDHSRLFTGYRWGFAEDTVRLAAALRPALAARGVPESIYVDNGSAYCDAWLLRACASLGIKLTHSAPGRPQGRGKIERAFRTVTEQFLVELTEVDRQLGDQDPAAGLLELNRLFDAWVEQSYHRAVHSETGQSPLARWHAGWTDAPPPTPTPAALAEAFKWEAVRRVTKTATVSLHANHYQVDPVLVGRKVTLVFDPFDLTTIEVRHAGRPMGLAIPHVITRHSHPKARPEIPDPAPPATGIDYLALVADAHHADLAAGVNYSALAPDPMLEAELADFAALSRTQHHQANPVPDTEPDTGLPPTQTPQQIPGQLDIDTALADTALADIHDAPGGRAQ
jgi:putative transposase